MLRAVALRFESGAIDVDLDSVELDQRSPSGLQPRRGDAVVVGEEDAHATRF